MARNGGFARAGRIRVDCVVPALALKLATILMQMFEQFGPFHARTG
jgi:hypothetical protein